MEILRSVCPYDCPDTCGLLIYKDGETVVKVEGDPEHSFTRGTLCPKMAHYERTVHSPRRILTPLLRTGPKGSGSFTPISWDEAIEIITSRWKKIITQYGAEAILPYSYAGTMGLIQRNSGHPLFYSLGASRLKRTICSPAKEYGWKAVMGQTMAPHPNEIQNSDLIILWGISALATDIHIMHDINIAKTRGAKIWLIDTYETATAKISDKFILIRPGTDGALALGMMHIIARDNLLDKDFIKKYVQGYEELEKTILPYYSPETVSKITGIDICTIEEIAGQYAHAYAPFIRLGSGLSRYGNGAMTVRIITCLPSVVGAWKKAGGGILTGTTTASAFDTKLITREDFQKDTTRIINMNELGDALNDLNDPPIMGLYVYSSNPAITAPDQNRVLEGLARQDLFTVVHERFITDTAKYADVILPATSSLEHSDIYRAYGHYVIQCAFKVINAVGQSKSNWEVFCLLAKAMGINDIFFDQSEEAFIDNILSKPTPWLEKTKIKILQEGRPLDLPLPDDYKLQFRTPSGKIEILNSKEEEPLPKYIAPYGDKAEFWLVNSPDVRILDSSFNERTDLTKKDKMILQMNPVDADKRELKDGQTVVVFNERGRVIFTLKISIKVPKSVVVTEGVWWIEHALGDRSINALTSQRLTDKGAGSTFYDVKVNVRKSDN